MSKEETIAKVFYDQKKGFGSLARTLQQARAVDPRISRQDVRSFLDKQKVRQRRKRTLLNSYVPTLPREQFQIDLMDMGSGITPRYGLVAIDIFTKRVHVEPLVTKNAVSAMRAVYKALGYPAQILSDEGGEFTGEPFRNALKAEEIEQTFSRTGGRFVERVIRTIKQKLDDRTEALGGKWTTYIDNVLEDINSTKHSATGHAPDEFDPNGEDMDLVKEAHAKMRGNAKRRRTDPPLEAGDSVKMLMKPSGFGDYKEKFVNWSEQVYEVERVDDSRPADAQYYLKGFRRPLRRFELKKVEDVQVERFGTAVSQLDEERRAKQALERVMRSAKEAGLDPPYVKTGDVVIFDISDSVLGRDPVLMRGGQLTKLGRMYNELAPTIGLTRLR